MFFSIPNVLAAKEKNHWHCQQQKWARLKKIEPNSCTEIQLETQHWYSAKQNEVVIMS